MNTAVKLGAFALGLVAVFAGAAGVGNAVGPVGVVSAAETGHAMGDAADGTSDDGAPHDGDGTTGPAHEDGTSSSGDGSAHDDGSGASHDAGHPADPETRDLPAGLTATMDGYTLALEESVLPAGASVPLAFRVLDDAGAPLTSYQRLHDKELHLIVVRRDLTGFQHVHPERAPDGTWRTSVALRPGDWRVFADFAASGADGPIALGADLAVAGSYDPQPLGPATSTTTVDGYTVELTGDLESGAESELTLSVSRDGRPVSDLQPYLGSYGHLVVLRAGDLGYLHVHPAGSPGDGVTPAGPGITFFATAPSAGSYRLFLDFQHDGVVRTAVLTVHTGATHTDVHADPHAVLSDGGAE